MEETSTRTPVVETKDLTKRYGRKILAVDELDLSVMRGEVYGFLGPNGAGKTTTLRMLLGLIKPSSGTARVLGGEPGTPGSLSHVGALVESPAFYPYLSGRNNLKVVARLSGVEDKGRIDEVLKEVELTGRASDKYKKYSLGMKQRLGVAAALLKDPELLILDEPTNGLDPKGMAEMRELIRSVGQGDRTVLLSSHLMNEVEQVCGRVGVISKGRLVAEGAVDELRGKSGLVLKAEPIEEAAEAARNIEEVEEVEVREDAIHLTADPEKSSQIGQKLYASGVQVSELHSEQRSLEDVFLELTGEEQEEEQGGERSQDQEQSQQHSQQSEEQPAGKSEGQPTREER